MLKIPKGLKKKKKDKKHKRKGDDDLFNEEELERYRKEHQHQALAAESTENAAGDNANASSSSTEKGEEWKKFNALTAGIDNILQKTQEDLDRIKSTSFFQRKAPPPPPPPPEPEKKEEEVLDSDKDKKKKKKEKKKVDDEKTTELEGSSVKVEDGHSEAEEELDDAEDDDFEEEESEEEPIDDSIFETSFVEAVTSGALKLAYIPDSPEEKQDDFDPFDTSIADKFIESNPKKRYLNLGCAVQVLSGKPSTNCPLITVEKRSRRVKPVDLLLSSFDEGTNPPPDLPQGIEKYLVSDSTERTLLDDGPLFDDSDLPLPPAPAVTPISVGTPLKAPPPTVATTPQIDFSEFEVDISSTVVTSTLAAQESVESVDEEFAHLAAESLARKSSLTVDPVKRPTSVDLLTRNVLGSPGSGHPSPINPNALEKHEPDPFDTSAAEKHLLPGKQEINLLEKELLETRVQLSQLEDDDFDPRADSPVIRAPTPPDILTKSTEEEVLAISGGFKPLTPQATLPESESPVGEDYDPFDTSHVNGAPGKLELKIIEKELAAADFEDDDFDPRKSDEDRPKITEVILNKYNISLDSTENKASEEEVYVDILTGDAKSHEIEGEEFVPTVQPRKLSDPDEVDEAYQDPFDTSIAENIVPGKTELKILENELIN